MATSTSTGVVLADLRDEEVVLGEAGKLLDFTQPVALLFVACLHHSCCRLPVPPRPWR